MLGLLLISLGSRVVKVQQVESLKIMRDFQGDYTRLRDTHFTTNRPLKGKMVMQCRHRDCGLVAVYEYIEDREAAQAYGVELGTFHRDFPDVDLMLALSAPGDDDDAA